MSTDLVGTTLGKYRILGKLGEGGMGAVYRAEDTRLGRHVALKVLSELAQADEESRKRFLTEARAASSLQHPNICTLFDFDEVDGTPFIAMQLVEGETLKRAIAKGPLSEERTLEVVTAVGRALAAAHEKGIVHRDVKPDNILLGDDGSIALTDFGVARLSQGETLTSTDQIVGTPAYMSPEQLRGERPTHATDQFALGAVAYECLTGKPPFAGENIGMIMHGILNEDPPAVSTLRHGLPSDWDGVLAKALAKESSSRHASVWELIAALPAPSPAPAEHASAKAGSIAILYFENMSSDPESDYFCAGLTEDLLTDLSKVSGIDVASRNAVARYRGQSVDIAKVGAELGVATVLEGSVRKVGDRVRINAQLIKTSNGFHMWAERYDRTLDDIFAVQDDITSTIARALRGALTTEETDRMQSDRPNDVRAYDHFLRGNELYGQYAAPEMVKALAEYEKAVEIEPTYAAAWARIAAACGQMVDKGFDLDPKWVVRAEEAARRAIELAPHMAAAHGALGFTQVLRRDYETSARIHEHAVQLDPAHAGCLCNLGSARLELGDVAGAERAFRRATIVDPAQTWGWMALGYLLNHTGRPREAIETAHAIRRTGGSLVYQMSGASIRARACLLLGDDEGLRAAIQEWRTLGLSDVIAEALQACMERRPSKREMKAPSGKYMDWSQSFQFAVLAEVLYGEGARAVELLRFAERHGPHDWLVSPVVMRVNPAYARVRHEPVFQDFLGDRARRLVWPLEAPPLPPEDRAQFTDYTEATGIPGDGDVP